MNKSTNEAVGVPEPSAVKTVVADPKTDEQLKLKAPPIIGGRRIGSPTSPIKAKIADSNKFAAEFDAYIDKVMSDPSTTTLTKTMIAFMQDYVLVMAPTSKVVFTKDSGATKQLSFFNMIKNVAERSGDLVSFRKNWNILLGFFWKYKEEALGIQYVNRYADAWQSKDPRRDSFQKLVNICMASANPATRFSVSKTVSIPKTVNLEINETGRQMITLFYTTH